MKKYQFRTIFLSDTHLGMKGCQADQLNRFLKCVKCKKIYLVGDIIDMWLLKSRWYWPAEHNDVIRRLLKRAKKGTQVIFVPGNHDQASRQFDGLEFGGIELRKIDVHETAAGKRMLITHGDQFDLIVKHSRLLSHLGGVAYDWLVWINRWYNQGRRALGLKYWSLSQYLKLRVKSACRFISKFEETLMDEARRRKCDGVICGHIHKAEAREDTPITYYNCGDWIESCSAIVEHLDGRLEVIDGLKLIEDYDHAKAELKAQQAHTPSPTTEHDEPDFEDELETPSYEPAMTPAGK